jgi:outer membrane protein TolC
VRYYSPRGAYRALTGRHEPFFEVGVTLELPFGNRAARGRAAQAEASLRSSSVVAGDLARTTDANVVGVAESLQRASESVASWTAAITSGNQTLAGALARFQSGDFSLIDTLLTEESLTNDQLLLVRQRQVQLSVLARLRFEAGTLVSFDGLRTPDERVRFQSTDLVTR